MIDTTVNEIKSGRIALKRLFVKHTFRVNQFCQLTFIVETLKHTFLTVFILNISNYLIRLLSKGSKGTNTLAYLLKVSEVKNKVLGH